MCGIAETISLGASLVGAQTQLAAMIGALRHRGPEGMGYYSHCAVGQAHARPSYDDFVDRLNGQFAIALWNSRKQRLLLVRDRPGIRPRFIIEHAQRLWFASEMKSLQ